MKDCTECGKEETCPLVTIIPWLSEHEAEVQKAKEDTMKEVSLAFGNLVDSFPPVSQVPGLLATLCTEVFAIGYHKGRQFPPVPAILLEEKL